MPTHGQSTPSYATQTPTQLSNYTADVLRLVHDEGNNIYSSADVTAVINEARNRVVSDTACLRALQQWCMNPLQESYNTGVIPAIQVLSGGSNYTSPTINITTTCPTAVAAYGTVQTSGGVITGITLTNGGSGYDMVNYPISLAITDSTGSGATFSFGAPSVSTLAVLGINLSYGTTRYAMDWKPWSVFSAKLRYWIGLQQQPTCWAEYGGSVYVGPIPDQIYAIEEDSLFFPLPLVNSTDQDVIPIRYQSPIKYYAAYLLKISEQSLGESDFFKQKYDETLANVVGNSVQRRIPSQYTSNVTGY
jgi:hypothetical protein